MGYGAAGAAVAGHGADGSSAAPRNARRRREDALEVAAPRAGASVTLNSRVASAASRLATIALACVPASLGVGLFATLYVADADDIWHQYRAVLLYPADAFVALTCLAWLVSLVAEGRTNARTSLVPLGIGALGIGAAVSALSAIDAVIALSVAAHLVVLAVFAAAAGHLVGTRGGPFWKVLSLTVIAEAALAVWQAVTQSTAPGGAIFNGWPREFSVDDSVAVVAVLPGVDRWLRAYGSFPHPNILGIFLAVALVMLSLRAEPSRLTRAAQLAGVVALSLTFSRSAWLAISLATVTWVVMTQGWRGIPMWIGQQLRSRRVLAAFVAIGLILAGVRVTQLDAFPEANSLSQRQIYDDAAWSLIAEGRAVGAGNILIAEQRQGIAVGEPAHNVFLITLAELGPIGVLAWLALLATLVAAAWRRADPRGRGAAVAAAVLVPLLLLDHYVWTQPPGRIWLVLALAIIPAVTSVRSSERRPSGTSLALSLM